MKKQTELRRLDLSPSVDRSPSRRSETIDDAPWIVADNELSGIPTSLDDDASRHIRRVARDLHSRYERETKRWRSYEALFSFMSFAALLLTVLYLQSNAETAFHVHSTIHSILPPSSTMASGEAVLQWIQTTLKGVWRDPVCGDGVCATPFEFASYGRFGCRADCGKLQEVQNLTTLLIDLSYDFHHPANSIAASELMNQASWNLCPKNGAPHGMDCYYSEAQRFESLAGEVHRTLDDIPDGQWEIHIKRDFFNKVSGAVRVLDKVMEQAAWSRKYGAYLAATADQAFEIEALKEAIAIAETTAYNFTIQQLDANLTRQYAQYVEDLTQESITQSEFDALNATLHEAWTFTKEQLQRSTCVCTDAIFEVDCQDASTSDAPQLMFYCHVSDCDVAVGFDPETDADGNPLTTEEICVKYGNLTDTAIQARLAEVQYILAIKRIGGSDGHTGKIGIRASKKAEQRSYITQHFPELYDWIFTNVDGSNPDIDKQLNTTKYDALAKYLSDGPTGYLDPSSLTAQLQLTKIAVQSATLSALLSRAYDRIAEIETQQQEVRQLPVIQELLENYSSDSISDQWITQLLPVFIEYNHVSWDGGAEEYLTCNLDVRGIEYVGQCVEKISCIRDNNTAPYECPQSTDLSDTACGSRCSFQEDCAALCACDDACTSNQLCSCDACTSLVDALVTPEYQSLQVEFSRELAETTDSVPSGRKLKQEDSDDSIAEHLLDLSESVNALRVGQTDLKTQVTPPAMRTPRHPTDGLNTKVVSLETEVQVANDLASSREEDNSLQDLINQGRSEIAAGQETVEELLVEIIGKQNETLEAVEEATETVKALEEMTIKSLEAQSAIHVLLREQMNAIKIAYQQNLITLDQAAELWKLARRERLVSDKDAQLSTYRCSPDTVMVYEFEVDNYAEAEDLHSRERYIGLTNRVVAGMLLHSVRTRTSTCPNSRFADIEDDCRHHLSSDSFGVDPVFKSGTTMYNPDLDNADSMIYFYNCSELQSPTYDRVDPYSSSGNIVNQMPFCMELFNMRNVPYGFRSFKLDGKPMGFPVWYDINLSELEAERWYTYIKEGLFLDGNTKSLTAEMVVYNGELNTFGYVEAKFDFTDGGAIQVSNRISTAKVELYQGTVDFLRLTLEIILTGVVFGWLLLSGWAIRRAYKETGSIMKSFASMWTWLDLGSNALLVVTVLMWWSHVIGHAQPFDIDLSYDVYTSLNPPAAYLKLSNDGEGLRSVHDGFRRMNLLVQSLSWYYALNGLSILLLIVRMLKKMDFQPRLGIVTRSIALAGPDLLHFSVVSGLVFFGYAMMAQLIFGSSVLNFSTFGRSVNTCFEILLGDVSVNTQLKELSGLQSLAGTLFFWSFELLVFLVLLNFLLAIIVDAFSVVKENTSETTGIHTEIYQMVKHKWSHLLGWMTDRHFVPYDRLGAMLRHYGTAADDNTESINRPNPKTKIKARRHTTVLKDEMDALTLRNVLSQFFKDDRFEGIFQRRASLFRRGDASQTIPTEAELDDMASSLLQQLGTDPDTPSFPEKEAEIEKEQLNEVLPSSQTLQSHRSSLQLLECWSHDLKQAQESLLSSLDELATLQREIINGQQQQPRP